MEIQIHGQISKIDEDLFYEFESLVTDRNFRILESSLMSNFFNIYSRFPTQKLTILLAK
jgi:hypothetical protein